MNKICRLTSSINSKAFVPMISATSIAFSSASCMQKISNSIVLIAPFNYDIENEMARDEIKNKLSVSWLKNNN